MPAIAALVVGIVAAAGALASDLLPIPFGSIAATSASIAQPATASISQNVRSPIEPVNDADTFNETRKTDGDLSSAENQDANIDHLLAEDAAEQRNGRVLGEQAITISPSFLSQFSTFLRSFDAYVASPLAGDATAYPRYGGYLPQSDGTTALSSPAITGGTITDVSSGSFDALSAGALNLSGALTGTDATFSGVLTAGTLVVSGVSSGGAITAPYFTATSTSATSTFAGAFSAASSAFNILQNGNVGIGTTTSNVMGANANSRVLSISGDGAVWNGNGRLELINPRAQASLAAGDDAGRVAWSMANNMGLAEIGEISTTLDGAGGVAGYGGKILFRTKDDNVASLATRMVIDSAGNVGIGTTTPWGKLSITGSGTGTGLAFAVADSANTPRFVIQDNGNIGIGTAAPNAKLQVADFINFDTANQSMYVGKGTGGFPYTANSAIGNTVFGHNALRSVTASSLGDNTAFGTNVMAVLTTGMQNVGVGADVMDHATIASNNTAIGDAALLTLTEGGYNVAVGKDTLMSVTTASQNVGVGATALRAATGADNTALGTSAGYAVTSGQRNILIGSNADTALTTGSNNIVIGYNINLPTVSSSNMLDIANLIYATGLNGSGTTLSTGNVGIGTTTPTAQLSTTGTVRFSTFGAGTLTTDASGNLSVSSDERLKTIDGAFTRGLADVLQLSPIQYHWNSLSGLDTSTQYAGFSAQNVQSAIPEAVGSSTSGYLTLQDRPLIAAAINAVKELASQITDILARLTTQEERNAAHEVQLAALEARVRELEAHPVINPDGSYTITTSNQPAPPLPEPDSDTTATSTSPAIDATTASSSPTTVSSTPTQQPSNDNSFNTAATSTPANDNASSASAAIVETAAVAI